MKMLKDGSMAFYRKRIIYFFYALAWGAIGCFLSIFSMLGVITGEMSLSQNFFSNKHFGIGGMCFLLAFIAIFFVNAITCFLNFLNIRPYVKLNGLYIEIQSPHILAFWKLPHILWEDIYEAHVKNKIIHIGKYGPTTHRVLCFKIRDIDAYKRKLSLFQKTTAENSEDIFYIDLNLLPKKDEDILLNEIGSRITLTK
jgi:hypothetical protein